MNSSSENCILDKATVLAIIGLWTIREVFDKTSAVKYGRKEWCTARPSNGAYENIYNSSRGRLFIFELATKERPQYQLFKSVQGHIEFRNGGNQAANSYEFVEKNPELAPVFVQQEWHITVNNSNYVYVPGSLAAEASRATAAEAALTNSLHLEYVGTATEMPIQAVAGQMLYRADTSQTMFYDGTQWVVIMPNYPSIT